MKKKILTDLVKEYQNLKTLESKKWFRKDPNWNVTPYLDCLAQCLTKMEHLLEDAEIPEEILYEILAELTIQKNPISQTDIILLEKIRHHKEFIKDTSSLFLEPTYDRKKIATISSEILQHMKNKEVIIFLKKLTQLSAIEIDQLHTVITSLYDEQLAELGTFIIDYLDIIPILKGKELLGKERLGKLDKHQNPTKIVLLIQELNTGTLLTEHTLNVLSEENGPSTISALLQFFIAADKLDINDALRRTLTPDIIKKLAPYEKNTAPAENAIAFLTQESLLSAENLILFFDNIVAFEFLKVLFSTHRELKDPTFFPKIRTMMINNLDDTKKRLEEYSFIKSKLPLSDCFYNQTDFLKEKIIPYWGSYLWHDVIKKMGFENPISYKHTMPCMKRKFIVDAVAQGSSSIKKVPDKKASQFLDFLSDSLNSMQDKSDDADITHDMLCHILTNLRRADKNYSVSDLFTVNELLYLFHGAWPSSPLSTKLRLKIWDLLESVTKNMSVDERFVFIQNISQLSELELITFTRQYIKITSAKSLLFLEIIPILLEKTLLTITSFNLLEKSSDPTNVIFLIKALSTGNILTESTLKVLLEENGQSHISGLLKFFRASPHLLSDVAFKELLTPNIIKKLGAYPTESEDIKTLNETIIFLEQKHIDIPENLLLFFNAKEPFTVFKNVLTEHPELCDSSIFKKIYTLINTKPEESQKRFEEYKIIKGKCALSDRFHQRDHFLKENVARYLCSHAWPDVVKKYETMEKIPLNTRFRFFTRITTEGEALQKQSLSQIVAILGEPEQSSGNDIELKEVVRL